MKNEKSKNCLYCERFCWWDGDFCCIEKFKILICEKDSLSITDFEALKNIAEKCPSFKKTTLKEQRYREYYKDF